MLEDDKIVAAAQAIGPHLPELIPEDAASVAAALAQHLTVPEGSKISANALVAILSRREPTRTWLAKYLGTDETSRAYVALLPDSIPVLATKYVCPYGDFTYFRPSVGAEVKPCPNHGIALKAAD